MRTNRFTLTAVAGATLATALALPAAAHEGRHADGSVTLAGAQADLAVSVAYEEQLLNNAIAWTNASPNLTADEKAALVAQLSAALDTVTTAAAAGASATTVDAVQAADSTADNAAYGAMWQTFSEYRTIAAAEKQAADILALQAKLAALVAQYTANNVQAPPEAGEAAALLAEAGTDAAAARNAAIGDPATAAQDLAASRADEKKAVADIANAANALAAALNAAVPSAPTTPTSAAPPVTTAPVVITKPVVDPRNPCDGKDPSNFRVGDSNDRRGWDGRGDNDRDRRVSFHR